MSKNKGRGRREVKSNLPRDVAALTMDVQARHCQQNHISSSIGEFLLVITETWGYQRKFFIKNQSYRAGPVA